MHNNYLKHYGIKKSKWSPQARAKYDARNRQLYGDEDNQNSERKAQSIRGKPPATNYKPQVAPKAGSNIGIGKKDPIDRRLKESKTWNSLTPEQKKRAMAINDAAKRANKQYTSYFGVFSSAPGKFLAKRNRKKRDGTATLLKYAEEVKKADDAKSARESKQATSSGPNNSGFGANIIKRTPGAKQVSLDKNGKVYKLEPTNPTMSIGNRTDMNVQSNPTKGSPIIDIIGAGYRWWKGRDYRKAKKEINKEYQSAVIKNLQGSSRKRNDSGKTTEVKRSDAPAKTVHGKKVGSLRTEYNIRQAIKQANHESDPYHLHPYQQIRADIWQNIMDKKIANAKTDKEYFMYKDIESGAPNGYHEYINQNVYNQMPGIGDNATFKKQGRSRVKRKSSKNKKKVPSRE